MPLTYVAIVVIAYFGPNAELLGNIKLAIWTFQRPILDIETFAFKVCLLTVVDFLSLIINALILRMFCGVNLLKYIKDLQREFWPVFAITECFILMEVRKNMFYFLKKLLT